MIFFNALLSLNKLRSNKQYQGEVVNLATTFGIIEAYDYSRKN